MAKYKQKSKSGRRRVALKNQEKAIPQMELQTAQEETLHPLEKASYIPT